MNEEVLKKLYASAKRFFDMPAYEVFASDMADEQKLIRFRESMAKHYDMPDIETFKSDIGFGAVKKKNLPILLGLRSLWNRLFLQVRNLFLRTLQANQVVQQPL